MLFFVPHSAVHLYVANCFCMVHSYLLPKWYDMNFIKLIVFLFLKVNCFVPALQLGCPGSLYGWKLELCLYSGHGLLPACCWRAAGCCLQVEFRREQAELRRGLHHRTPDNVPRLLESSQCIGDSYPHATCSNTFQCSVAEAPQCRHYCEGKDPPGILQVWQVVGQCLANFCVCYFFFFSR